MGVVTVVGEEGVQVLVEFVGGPRGGKRSFASSTTDSEGKPIPPTWFGAALLPDDAAGADAADARAADAADEAGAGRYVREGVTTDGEAFNYVWRTAPATVDVPFRPEQPDLATRIRRAYARRVASETDVDEPKRGTLASRHETTDRGGA